MDVTTARRKPRGYQGRGHETIGSDITAVLRCLTFPRSVLGDALTEELSLVRDGGWYPIEKLLRLMDVLDEKLGAAGLRKMGRTLFKNSHEPRVKTLLNCGRDVIEGIDAMYKHANRGGNIGGWRVLSFRPGVAEIEKTTPHNCMMEEGILLEALAMVKVPARIEQLQCLRKGDDHCRLVITSSITDEHWDSPTPRA